MGLDDSAHFSQLSAAHQCLPYFFSRLNYTLQSIVSQSPVNYAVNTLRSNYIEPEHGKPRRLSSQERSHTPLIPYRVNKLALPRKSSKSG